MVVINGNALTEKGNLKADVRKIIRGAISTVNVVLQNGKQITLESKGNGDYFGAVGQAEDGDINAKVSLVVTSEDYKEPVKATKKAVEKEAIDFEIQD